jgi:F0F1-type ATP synthase assembly protein I
MGDDSNHPSADDSGRPEPESDQREPRDAGDGWDHKDPIVREVDAYAVLSYLIGGVILYGGLGWLVDWWLGTRGFVAVGIVLGAAGGIAAVWLRYSKR